MIGRIFRTSNLREWLTLGLSVALVASVVAAEKKAAALEVRFRAERAGPVFINIHRADGTLVRRLVQGQRFAAGAQKVAWDGRADDGSAVEAGEYTWRGLAHEGVGLKLRGWAANGGTTPWATADGKGSWGGDAGVPSAVATDAQRVYLGWSLAEQGKAILACDLEGRIQWSHRRAEGASGCKALAVDDGLLYVLGGLAGADAEGGAIYRLNVKDGKPVPWPSGKLDLKIAKFWPADSTAKPERADGMAVRHDRIYLTFTSSQFLTVLNAKTGEYLQTVVGAPPGQIDVAPTKTDLPTEPGKIVDADFAVISLRGGVLGKVLFAHDPLWVITSELTPVEGDVHISALTVIGDGAKFHRHTAFVALGAPLHQIHARPLLDMETFTWVVGKAEGRPPLGPWQAESLRAIRAVALDGAGRLWAAESDGFPKRFSVWDTTGQQGKLVRDFFGPADTGTPGGAINPLDPDLMFAQGCEWRLDRQTGQARCLGVITREAVALARYGVGENGNAYLVTSNAAGALQIFERLGDGDYRLRARIFPADAAGAEVEPGLAKQTIFWADENGDGLLQASEQEIAPEVLSIANALTAQDLALHASGKDAAWLYHVQKWTSCGSPRYGAAQREALPASGGSLSADRKWILSAEGAARVCRDLATGREQWRIAGLAAAFCGSARLAEPIGNIWLVRDERGRAQMLTEGGFVLAEFFAPDAATAVWPKSAAPGADLTKAHVASSSLSVAQAVDGHLYLQAGDAAYWNLEVAGLDKVRALSGGAIVVSPAK